MEVGSLEGADDRRLDISRCLSGSKTPIIICLTCGFATRGEDEPALFRMPGNGLRYPLPLGRNCLECMRSRPGQDLSPSDSDLIHPGWRAGAPRGPSRGLISAHRTGGQLGRSGRSKGWSEFLTPTGFSAVELAHPQSFMTGQVRVRVTPSTAWILATTSLPSSSMSAASASAMTSMDRSRRRRRKRSRSVRSRSSPWPTCPPGPGPARTL